MDADEVVRRADEAGLRLVRFLWCGNDGTVRAKASALRGLEARLRSGIGLTVGMQAMNALDQLQPVEGMGPVGEVRLVPDLDTFRVLPYAPHTGARADRPRRARRRAGARVPALVPQADGGAARRARRACSRSAFENEFSLATRGRRRLRADRLRALLLDDQLDGRAVLRRRPRRARSTRSASSSSSTTPSSATASTRSRPSTHPRCARPTSSCSCARRSAASRARHGLVASLAPKPWPDNAGNGCHIHFSLWDADGSRNRFHDPAAPDGLSAEARSFVAGVLAHLPGAVRADRAELQLVPPHRPAVLGRRVRLLGPRQPRGAGPRAVARSPGSEEASTNVELKAPTRARTRTWRSAG